MKAIIGVALLTVCNLAQAALEPLSNQSLQDIDGQAGADLSLNLVLNQNVLTSTQLETGMSPTFNCTNTNLAYCHLAISFNKRFVQPTADTDTYPTGFKPDSDSGNKLWLVFKGIQGTINIQKLGLDGTDLNYSNESGSSIIKPAIQLGFSAAQPIQIRNFGFDALSIEQDNFTSSYDNKGQLIEGSSSTPSDYGYLKANVYGAPTGTINPDNYDIGKETGFVGVMMNGNLAIQGKMMMFSCNDTHPRC